MNLTELTSTDFALFDDNTYLFDIESKTIRTLTDSMRIRRTSLSEIICKHYVDVTWFVLTWDKNSNITIQQLADVETKVLQGVHVLFGWNTCELYLYLVTVGNYLVGGLKDIKDGELSLLEGIKRAVDNVTKIPRNIKTFEEFFELAVKAYAKGVRYSSYELETLLTLYRKMCEFGVFNEIEC